MDPEPDEHSAFLAAPDPVGLYAEPAAAPGAPPVRACDTRPAKRLRLVSLIVLGLSLSGLGVAQSLGATVPVVAYVAVPLLILGLTLVVATWLGRARGLLPAAVLLAIAVLGVSTAQAIPAVLAAAPPITRSYATLSDAPIGGDRIEAGRLVVDLSRLQLSEDASYAAAVEVGSVEVVVPPQVRVVVNYRLDVGSVQVLSTPARSGPDLHGQIADPLNPADGQPTLTLDLSADAGNVQVHR